MTTLAIRPLAHKETHSTWFDKNAGVQVASIAKNGTRLMINIMEQNGASAESLKECRVAKDISNATSGVLSTWVALETILRERTWDVKSPDDWLIFGRDFTNALNRVTEWPTKLVSLNILPSADSITIMGKVSDAFGGVALGCAIIVDLRRLHKQNQAISRIEEIVDNEGVVVENPQLKHLKEEKKITLVTLARRVLQVAAAVLMLGVVVAVMHPAVLVPVVSVLAILAASLGLWTIWKKKKLAMEKGAS